VKLRVRLEPARLDHAVALLGEHGFTASRNGHSILIAVDETRKAEPLVLLASSAYAVTDFDLEDAS
jgi:hypothetical protein